MAGSFGALDPNANWGNVPQQQYTQFANGAPLPTQNWGTPDAAGAYDGWEKYYGGQAAADKSAADRAAIAAASGGGGWGGGGGGASFGAGYNPGAPAAPGGGSGGGGISTGGNPYLQQQGADITKLMTDNFNNNIMPGMNFAGMASGNTGSSRQGILQNQALSGFNRDLGSTLNNLYANNWQQDQSRMVGSRDTNRSLDLQQAQVGSNMFQQGVQGAQGLGAGVFGLGSQQQQAPWNVLNQAQGVYQPWSGLGTSQNQQSGGGLQGILGGLLAGGQLYNAWSK